MSCSICLEDYNEDIKTLDTCNHMYHTDCINQWLNNHITCPLCRNITQTIFDGSYIKYPIFPIITKKCKLELNSDYIKILFNKHTITMKINKIKTIRMYYNTISFVYNISETNNIVFKNYSINFNGNIKHIYNHIIRLLNAY